jgi:hypothetical protein
LQSAKLLNSLTLIETEGAKMTKQRNRQQASDDTYNARRRFIRAAKRYLDKSYDAVGSVRNRYREMARDATLKAAELYQRKANIKRKGDFERLAREFNVNLSEFITDDEPTERETQRRKKLERESKEVTAQTSGTAEQRTQARRESEARAILNSPIGSRIYAGLVDVWAQPAIEGGEIINKRKQEDIDALIMEHYGVNNMMDVIEILEQQNPNLYADPESLERYHETSISIAVSLYE